MYAPEELLLVLGWRRDVVPRCCPGAGVLEGRWLRCSRATSSTLLPSLGPLAFVWLILKIVFVAARVAHPPRPATALVVVLGRSSSLPRPTGSSRVRSADPVTQFGPGLLRGRARRRSNVIPRADQVDAGVMVRAANHV